MVTKTKHTNTQHITELWLHRHWPHKDMGFGWDFLFFFPRFGRGKRHPLVRSTSRRFPSLQVNLQQRHLYNYHTPTDFFFSQIEPKKQQSDVFHSHTSSKSCLGVFSKPAFAGSEYPVSSAPPSGSYAQFEGDKSDTTGPGIQNAVQEHWKGHFGNGNSLQNALRFISSNKIGMEHWIGVDKSLTPDGHGYGYMVT